MTKILALDPGKTTGWAYMEVTDRTIMIRSFGETKDEALLEIQELFSEADEIVCEDFEVDPRHARRGAFNFNKMPAPMAIGSIKTLAALARKKVHFQNRSLKPVGYGYANLKYKPGKSGKGVHQEDAIAHGVYRAVEHLGARPLGVSVKKVPDVPSQ